MSSASVRHGDDEVLDSETIAVAQAGKWHWLWARFRPLLWWQIASVLLVVAGSAASLLDPLILKWLIDTILPNRNFPLLMVAVLLVFLSYQGRTVFGTLGSYCIFHANQRFILALRQELLAHMASLSADYHEGVPVGAKSYLVQDLTAELGQLSADVFPLALRTLVMAFLVGAAMIVLDRHLSLVALPLTLIFFLLARHLRKRLRSSSEAVQAEASRTSSILQEQLASSIQIQLLGREQFQAIRAFHTWAGLMRTEYRRKRAEIVYSTLSNSVIAAGVVAVLGYGGCQVMIGALTMGGLVAFYSYLARLFEPLYLAVEMSSRFQRIGAAVHRIRTFLDTQPAIRDDLNPLPFPRSSAQTRSGHVEMRGVAFGYDPHRNLVENLHLEIQPGERVAFVGESGGGKSTIAKLICRIYEVGAGSVSIDGLDVRRVQLSSLRSQVAYVPQRAAVFSGSIEENLRLGRIHLTTRDLLRVADVVELGPLLRRARKGWRQDVGPGGAKLSGGERQRLALARALLQSPRILVLDESTSELDPPAERAIYEHLNLFLPETTLVLITHRLNALNWVDNIFVIREGALIESGNHADLYARGGLYRNLYERQPLISQSSLHVADA